MMYVRVEICLTLHLYSPLRLFISASGLALYTADLLNGPPLAGGEDA